MAKESFYTAIYCGMQPAPNADGSPGLAPVPEQIQFEHFARSYMNLVMCGGPDGKPTGVESTPFILERHGSWAFVRYSITAGTQTKWKQAHPKGPLGQVEMAAASNLEAARTAAASLRTKVKAFVDAHNIPNAPTEIQRAINFLASLDLSNAHPGFTVVRDCYIEALSDTAGTEQHHWLWRPPFFKPVEPPGWPVDGAVIQAMLAELDASPQTDPRRVMNYALMYGALATVLDLPVT